MTILPKKKPQQGSGGTESENNETSSPAPGHQHQMGPIQTGESTSNRGTLYLSSQSPPPCWPPPPSSATPREEKRPTHTPPSHFEDTHENGGPASHSKRRYRASPLRSVRPKHRDLREHRGNASPPYPSTSSGWGVAPVSHPLPNHTLQHQHPAHQHPAHQHPIPNHTHSGHHQHPIPNHQHSGHPGHPIPNHQHPGHPHAQHTLPHPHQHTQHTLPHTHQHSQHPLPHQHQHSHSLPIANSITPALPAALSPQAGPSQHQEEEEEENDHSGYNSGDEYEPFGWNLTAEQWEEKERRFEKKMKKKGLMIKKMREDGACLFRAIADQVYGDQDMHSSVRKHCMDYIALNEDAFAPFVSENFQTYVQRKRRDDCFGNHIELAAMSEMYNRIIEVYCYSVEPINSFQGSLQTDNEPMRLSYHMGTHYNSLVDPYKATVGVGLGLPGFQPGLADKNLMKEATRQSENVHLEQAMLEDKIRATDFEATSEAIEEQVAHESYIQWLRDNDQRSKGQRSPSSPSSSGPSDRCQRGRTSPLAGAGGAEGTSDATRSTPRTSTDLARLSPRATVSSTSSDLARLSPRASNSPRGTTGSTSPRGSASPRAHSSSKETATPTPATSTNTFKPDHDPAIPGSSKDPEFKVNERASFLNHLPPHIFGLSEYSSAEADILAQVLAASQQEYLESLKTRTKDDNHSDASTSS